MQTNNAMTTIHKLKRETKILYLHINLSILLNWGCNSENNPFVLSSVLKVPFFLHGVDAFGIKNCNHRSFSPVFQSLFSIYNTLVLFSSQHSSGPFI